MGTGTEITDGDLLYRYPVLWNRNRRHRNFLPCGTGTVTCQKVGTGTVINYLRFRIRSKLVSQKFSQTHSKNCVFDFLNLTFFSFTF
jgi:hypothetical protein